METQSTKDYLVEKVAKVIKEVSEKEGGITYADLESIFGQQSGIITALKYKLKIRF